MHRSPYSAVVGAVLAVPIGCAGHAGPSTSGSPSSMPVEFVEPVQHLGFLAREPMVVQHPSGVLWSPVRPTQLAATWFSGRDDTLRANVAWLTMSNGREKPSVHHIAAFAPQSWTRGEGPPTRDPAGEYFPAVFLHDGGLAVVTTNQQTRSGRVGFEWRRTRNLRIRVPARRIQGRRHPRSCIRP